MESGNLIFLWIPAEARMTGGNKDHKEHMINHLAEKNKRYWLMKSEPEICSIDDLKNHTIECWDGVRNYQARNMMRDLMNIGDLAFFYHSNATPPGIAGIMEIVTKAYPDPSAFNPKSQYYDPKSSIEKPTWLAVDVQFKMKFPHFIRLETLRNTAGLEEMWVLKKGSRLSITPVTVEEWEIISKSLFKIC
jgi:predicted RNA-binding protein with PUA-like domain